MRSTGSGLGDAGILIISPEQLRNRSLRRVLGQREIGAWVGATYCSSHTGPAPTDIVSVPLAEQSGTIRLVSHLDEPPNGRSGVDGTRFLSGWLQQSTSGYSEHQHGRRKASKGFSLLAHRFRTPDVRLAKHPRQFFEAIYDTLSPMLAVSAADFSVRVSNSLNEVSARYDLFGGPSAVVLTAKDLSLEFPDLVLSDYGLAAQIAEVVEQRLHSDFPECGRSPLCASH